MENEYDKLIPHKISILLKDFKNLKNKK